MIGYGNSLRSDDGAGCRVAEIVASWQLPYVRSLSVHQLVPELVELLSEADLAIFVDACANHSFRKPKSRATVRVQRILPAECLAVGSGNGNAHHSDPRSLLLLAQQIYGRTPASYWLLLPGINWEFGEQLSAVAHKNIEQSVDLLKTLCTRLVPI